MVENMDKESENQLPETAPDAQASQDQQTDGEDAASSSVIDGQAKSIDLKEKIKRRIQHNLIYKISAIVLAALLWTYVTASQNPLTEATYTIPIEQRNLSSELALMEQNYQVQIRVQGNSTVINMLTTKDFAAYIDCTGVMAGEATLQVKVDLPAGVQLVSQSPETIDVSIENVVSEVFPVELKIIGQPAEGFSLMDALLTPSQITLYGPAEYMQQVNCVFVSADVTDVESSYNQNLSLEVLDAAGNNISQWFTIAPSTCNVVIPISASMPEKDVAVSAVINGKPATGFQISQIVVEPSTVKVLGDMEYLNQLYYIETQPIDVSGLRESVTRTVDLAAVNGITLSTSSVTVAIKIDAVSTASLTKDLVHVENLADTLSAEVPNVTVDIVVSGPETLIQDLDPTRVVPYVDCSNITEPGSYTLPISVSLPANISVASCDPGEITVQITEINGEGAGEINDASSGKEETDNNSAGESVGAGEINDASSGEEETDNNSAGESVGAE